MSNFANQLISPALLKSHHSPLSLPIELQHCIIYHSSRLTLSAGHLLDLPLDTTSRAIVLLQRYLSENFTPTAILRHELQTISAAILFLTAKLSSSPRSTRSICNVYTALLATTTSGSLLYPHATPPPPQGEKQHYLTEFQYHNFRDAILLLERQVLDTLSFSTSISLPHTLAITYLQTLDAFSASHPSGTGSKLAHLTLSYLNTALLSPQLLYLTHQPNALAVAAIYLAARQLGVSLCEEEWWVVFDVDREELGFLVVGMGSLEGWLAEVFDSYVAEDSFGRSVLERELRAKGLVELDEVGEMAYLEWAEKKRAEIKA